MKALSYITAAILFIAWTIGYLLFGVDRGIHVLVVLAFATVIQQVVQIRRFSNQLFRSSHSKKRALKFQLARGN